LGGRVAVPTVATQITGDPSLTKRAAKIAHAGLEARPISASGSTPPKSEMQGSEVLELREMPRRVPRRPVMLQREVDHGAQKQVRGARIFAGESIGCRCERKDIHGRKITTE